MDDNSDERPESISISLLQNGEVIDEQEVSAEFNWTYRFDELPEFDENGVAYDYTVEEEPVDGYESTVDGYDITNLRVGQTSVSGEKTWVDDDSEDRPEQISVNLLANGTVVDTRVVTADEDWKYQFTDLDKYDQNGVEIEYTVKEQDVPGYQSEVDGFDITNTRSESKNRLKLQRAGKMMILNHVQHPSPSICCKMEKCMTRLKSQKRMAGAMNLIN